MLSPKEPGVAREIDFVEILAQAQEQLADIATVHVKQAALVATAQAADGLVEVSVNARGIVIETKIDCDYLDEYDLSQLGDHITRAAQAAAEQVQHNVAELMGPINDRRKAFPSLSDILEGAPDLREMQATVPKVSLAPPNSVERLNLEGEPTVPDREDDQPWHTIRA